MLVALSLIILKLCSLQKEQGFRRETKETWKDHTKFFQTDVLGRTKEKVVVHNE